MSATYRSARCPLCFFALYDGDWCQGPKDCPNVGKPVENAVRLTSPEAIAAIDNAKDAQNYPLKP
jgi:hypothetical protein